VEVPLLPGATVTELGDPQMENVGAMVVQVEPELGTSWNTNVW
jgi:hypothetical protein